MSPLSSFLSLSKGSIELPLFSIEPLLLIISSNLFSLCTQVSVSLQSGGVRVAAKEGVSEKVLMEGEFTHKINTENSLWSLEPGRCVLVRIIFRQRSWSFTPSPIGEVKWLFKVGDLGPKVVSVYLRKIMSIQMGYTSTWVDILNTPLYKYDVCVVHFSEVARFLLCRRIRDRTRSLLKASKYK